MSTDSTHARNAGTSKMFCLLSIFAFLYWTLGQIIDVYRFAWVGAVYELLWLPMMGILFFIPILSLVFLANEKFAKRSFYPYSFLIAIMVILLMVFR